MPEANTENLGSFILEPPVPMIWADLVKSRVYKPKKGEPGKPQFRATFLIRATHPLLEQMKAQMVAVAKAGLPGVAVADIDFPIQNGDRMADEAKEKKRNHEYLRGFVVLNTKSVDNPARTPPRLKVLKGGALLSFDDDERALAKDYLYPGVLATARINFAAWKVDDNCYLTAYLNAVYSLNKGDRIATGGGESEEFVERMKGYAGVVSAVDPTAKRNLDDEILDDEIPY